LYIFLSELFFTSTNNQKTISPIIGDTDFAVAADGSFVRTADFCASCSEDLLYASVGLSLDFAR
jgi:hypothetical protein